MSYTAPQFRFIKENYDPLENVSVTMHIPLEQDSLLENGELPTPEKITKDLFESNPPPGITPINIKVLRAIFLKDQEAKMYAFKNQNLDLLSPEGWVPPYGDGKPLTGLDRYSLDGLLIATISVDLRDLMTQSINYDMGANGILKNLKNYGIDRKTFEIAKAWLIDNYESIPQARIGASPNPSQIDVDQWPAPKLSSQNIKSIKKITPPDFDLEWH